jgi:predicted enzyme related to lactoylglutathione lyase
MGSPVIHFEVGGSDAERSRRFYQELFGWEITVDGSGYGAVRTGSKQGIGGGVMQAPPGRSNWVTFYVAVDDLETSLRSVEELGGTRITEPVPVGEVGSFAMFADPDGNMIGLFAER